MATVTASVATAPPAAAAGPTRAARAGSVTVRLAHAAHFAAPVLVTGAGRTLYVFTPDHRKAVTCTGECAAAWPPLPATGKPVAGPGVRPALLGRIRDANGKMQVTYNRWPLYTFSRDKKAGQVTGEGVAGKWFVLNAAGQPVRHTTAAAGASGGGW